MLNERIPREAPGQLIAALEATWGRSTASNDDAAPWYQLARYIDCTGAPWDTGYACANFALMGGIDDQCSPEHWDILYDFQHHQYRFESYTPGTSFSDALGYIINPVGPDGNGVFPLVGNGHAPGPQAPRIEDMVSAADLNKLKNLARLADSEGGNNWRDIPWRQGNDLADANQVMRNKGANHNTARCRFWHKLLKRVAEMYGWEIQKYHWDPGNRPEKAIGIACTSSEWWSADHWGIVLRNAVVPNGQAWFEYTVFQTATDRNKRVWGWCERLWDTQSYPMTVLWVKEVPTYVRERISAQYA